MESSATTGKSVAGITDLFVDDFFGAVGNEREQRVLTRRRKDFQVGSEDWYDVTSQKKEFVGHKLTKLGRTLKLVKKGP